MVKPSRVPSIKKMRDNGIRAFFAASVAILIESGTVKRNFASATLRAWVISSTPYAGDAPHILPPALVAASIVTGYHIVF